MSNRYEIRVGGRLDARWAARFDGMTLRHDDGDTVIAGSVTDQSALHGILRTLHDLGLTLLSVTLVPDPARPGPGSARPGPGSARPGSGEST